jgi:hypothetical protein
MAAAAGVTAALAFPLSASAKTVVVDSGAAAGACSGTAPVCKSLTEASSNTVTAPGDTVEVHPGYYPESPTFGQRNLKVKGAGGSPILIVGTLSFTGAGSLTVSRLVIQSPSTPLSINDDPVPAMNDNIVVEGTALLTSAQTPALTINASLSTGQNATATVRHVTAASLGGPSIKFTSSAAGPLPGSFTGTVKNSISFGGIDPTSADSGSNDTPPISSAGGYICDSLMHLVKGSPAIGKGGTLDTGEIDEDIDGEKRTGTLDRGADQYSPKCDPSPNQTAPPLPPTPSLPPPVTGGPAAPTVRISSPSARAKLKRVKTSGRGRHRHRTTKQLLFTGTASDPLGLSSVQIALRKTGGGTTTCQWFDGKKLAKVPCAQVILLQAPFAGQNWSYTISKRASLPKGSYILYATAVNKAGVAQTALSQANGNVVSFKVS